MAFTHASISDQSGKTIVVTGANVGLGYETAKALAGAGADIVLACRSEAKARKAIEQIHIAHPHSALHFIPLDLMQLDSVRAFAEAYSSQFSSLDVLINNAGIMCPPYSKTEYGFESQMGANYAGHFLLTGLLLPQLEAAEAARVVSLSSLAHLSGSINFADLHWEKSYSRMKAYQQSKLACLMFALQLQHRLQQNRSSTISVAAHPGISPTELSRHIPRLLYYPFLPMVKMISHSPKQGALPSIMAASEASVQGGQYFGPTGAREFRGPAGPAKIARRAQNETAQLKLWQQTEELLDYRFPV